MAEENKQKAPPPPPPPPPAGGGKPAQKPEPDQGGFSGLRVSLMPRDLEGEGKPDLKLRLLALGLVLILETGAVLAGLYFINQEVEERVSKQQALEQQLDAARSKAAKAEQDMKDALVFQSQLIAVDEALDKHIYSSKILEYLEKNTLEDVTLTRIQINTTSEQVGLDVEALGYRRLAEQIVHLTGLPEIVQVKNSSVSGNAEPGSQKATATTALILTLKPSIWLMEQPIEADDNQS